MRNKTLLGASRIICPFFRHHAPTQIGCEGITEHCVINIVFDSKAARDQQEKIFCEDRFKWCEIYRAIAEKYED